jgi:hypothetical protein
MPSTLSPQEFIELAGTGTDELLCSLYFPLDPAGVDQRAKKLQLKNAINRLKAGLTARDWPHQKSEQLATSLELLEHHESFLSQASAGLAVLVPAGQPEALKVLALDFRPEESLTLGEHYSIAPLLRLFGSSLPRTVLALADGGLRMMRGTAQYLESVALPESFPQNRDEVMKFEQASGLEGKDSTQHRVGSGMSYHGEGPKETVDLEISKRYYRDIGQALTEILSEHETVLLAGVHEQIALFRKVNPELPLLFSELAGNFESQPLEQLQAKAQTILGDVERSENLMAVAQTKEMGCEWWSTDPRLAQEAAQASRVHLLFVNVASLGEPATEELVLEVLKHGGLVRTLDNDQLESACLARFRWAASADSDSDAA